MVERNGNVKAVIVNDSTENYLLPEIVGNISLGSTLYSGELTSYSKLERVYDHKIVKHSQG